MLLLLRLTVNGIDSAAKGPEQTGHPKCRDGLREIGLLVVDL